MTGKYEKFQQASLSGGAYRWRYRHSNGKILFGSTEGYVNAADRDACLLTSMGTNANTPVVDLGLERHNSLAASGGITSAYALFNQTNYGAGLRLPTGGK